MPGGTPLASAFIRVRPDMSTFRREAESGLDGAGTSAGRGFGEEFEDAARRSSDPEALGEETGRRFGSGLRDSLKVAAGVAIAAIGEQAASKLSEGFASALDASSATAQFQADLGVTAEQSKKIGQSAGKLFSNAYGENMGEVNDAITSVIRNIDGMRDASSESLETMTARAITTGGILKADVGDVTKSVSQLLRTGLAKNAEEAFDLIVKGAQNGADANGDLLDTINEYSTQFREVGISGPKAMGLLAQATKAGARDTDTAADAIKEFAILSKEASNPAVAAAFKALGLNSKEMFTTFNKGGPEADVAFNRVIKGLKGIKDPVKQGQLAVALFGTKAEDLGDALYAFDPTTAVQGLGELKGATDKASDALGSTPQAKLTAFKNSLQTNITNVIANNVIPVMANLTNAFTTVGVSGGGIAAAAVPIIGMGIAAKVTASAVGAVKTGINGIKTAAGGIKSVAQGVGSLASGFRSADAASSAFSGRMGTIGGKLRTAFNGSVNAVKASGSAIANAGRAALTASVSFGRAALATARSGAASALAAARTIAYTVVQKAAAAASRAWALAQVALNLVMSANPIALVVVAIAALVAAVVIAYRRSTTFKNIVDAAFRGIAAAGKFMWDKVLKPIFGFIQRWVGTILVAAFKVYWNIGKQVFAGISAAVKLAWDKVLGPIWRAIKSYIEKSLIPGFKLLMSVVRDVWNRIRSSISSGWNAISGYFNRLKSAIGQVGTAFGRGASAIRSAWDKIKSYTKAPVNFVIQTVYNRGIVGMWNKVMGWLHLPESMKLGTVPALASGGPMPVRPGVFNKPTAIVGEGNPRHPEYVIPTDPKYRGRARSLWQAAGGHMQMLQFGGIIGTVKKFASKAVGLGKDALDLIANPGKIWDRLVSALPSAKGLATSPFGSAISMIPKKILDPAKDYALKLFKAFGDSFGGDGQGVVKAALKYVGTGDDRGHDNDNIFTRQWGWPSGTPWCALFASTAIRDAKAGKKYRGYPTAAVAGYEGAMKHVGLGEGRPGDLATYAPSHINIIVKKVAGGYDTVGGNQGALVNRYVRGGQRSILRPLALGGTIDPSKLSSAGLRAVFAQKQDDSADGRNPLLGALRSQRRPQPGLFDSGGFGKGWPFHAKKPEAVLTDQQWADIHKLAMSSGKGGHTFNITGLPDIPSDKQITNALDRSSRLSGRW